MPQPTFRINFVTGAARRHIAEVEALAAVPERVAAAVAAQASGPARRAPTTVAPGEVEWRVPRILGHLIAYARQSHENLYRMAWMTDPVMKMTDDEGEAARNSWELQASEALLETLAFEVGRSVDLLADLPDASWGRPGQHPEAGRRSVRQHAVAMVEHFEEHIAQIGHAPV